MNSLDLKLQPAPATRRLIAVHWWIQLRWAGIVGLGLWTVTTAWNSAAWPPLTLNTVLGALSASNLWLRWRTGQGHVGGPTDGPLVAVLALDIALLTVVLGTWGGTRNPFSVLYLFPVTMGALMVSTTWTWILLAASAGAYGSLFLLDGADPHMHHDPAAMQAHLVGMFAAYAVTGPLITVAVTRIRAALSEADRKEASALLLQSRNEKLAALATLAAGAAHELSTPLSTILVVAKEMERRASGERDREDLRLIALEVNQCRETLSHLSADAGAGAGELPSPVDVAELISNAIEGLHAPQIQVDAPQALKIRVPRRLIQQAIRRLVGNARQATNANDSVLITVRTGDQLAIEVTDNGSGMSRETLARATEPFFTTRAEGTGRGLGLYFVRSVMHHLGGELTLDSTLGKGTTATLVFPDEVRIP